MRVTVGNLDAWPDRFVMFNGERCMDWVWEWKGRVLVGDEAMYLKPPENLTDKEAMLWAVNWDMKYRAKMIRKYNAEEYGRVDYVMCGLCREYKKNGDFCTVDRCSDKIITGRW